MKVSCDIQEVIAFLIDKMNEGYKTVEVIDDARAHGWFSSDPPSIEFIFSKKEPTVLGIKAFEKQERKI